MTKSHRRLHFLWLLAPWLCCAPAVAAQDAVVPASARVIVKFKDEPAMTTKAALASGRPSHAEALGTRLQLVLHESTAIDERTQVIEGEGLTSAALAAQLAQEPEVEYAVPDLRRRVQTAPNDPLYRAGPPGKGPDSGQWYLRVPDATVRSSINVEAAWAVTQGAATVVVAVLDTGVRYEHPDLLAVAKGGKLLPGYAMVSDPVIANNGVGRTADASDPGDWVTAAESDNPAGKFYGCYPEGSSWHGTQVSGLIGALTNNSVGMAAVAPNLRVLPVRVLGKCGGFDSDILAGMRWAGGLGVPGAPVNPTPARVLNLSLGGEGACSAAYLDVIAQLTAKGVVIVAAAGNSIGHAVGVPANCPGIIAVGGLRHAGSKVGYSDIGAEVALSAPAGNCVNIAPGAPCVYPILSTTNTGTTVPAASSYSDAYAPSLGTSFSAPLVAATAGLMLSANPTLSPQQVRDYLQKTARPFPSTGASAPGEDPVPRCEKPTYDSDGLPIDQLQCYCTTATCGAGMLDTGAVVKAVAAGNVAVDVVEYYWAARDHYFVTGEPAEIALLDSGALPEWQRTGYGFRAAALTSAGLSPVCRFYLPAAFGDSHYFSASPDECAQVRTKFPGFVLETTAAYFIGLPNSSSGLCAGGTVPVYRLWNHRDDSNHRYTTNRALRDQMVAKGYVAEGYGTDPVAMCAAP